ncbi:MAG: FYDLN acid domain-containing protein [Alphaproteobacteria bacterium]|nr:FYDLN acid domain-containing protein [Alphaproteobacteria bacterium]
MSAATDARGLKRICYECGARFYDMNKRPITCPSCAVEFTGEVKVKTRRGRSIAESEKDTKKTPANTAKDDALENQLEEGDEGDEEDEEDLEELQEVSLDDVAAEEEGDNDAQDEDDLPDLDDDDMDLDMDDDLDVTLEEDLDDDLEEDLEDVKKSAGGDD